jgi:hypothetical protein
VCLFPWQSLFVDAQEEMPASNNSKVEKRRKVRFITYVFLLVKFLSYSKENGIKTSVHEKNASW